MHVSLLNVNWRRGLPRVWLIGALIWCGYSFVAQGGAEKLHYAWRYHTDFAGLQAELNRSASTSQKAAIDAILDGRAVPPPPGFLVKGAPPLVPSPPDWSWLWPMFLPPTAGVALLIGAGWLIFIIARWIWGGFVA